MTPRTDNWGSSQGHTVSASLKSLVNSLPRSCLSVTELPLPCRTNGGNGVCPSGTFAPCDARLNVLQNTGEVRHAVDDEMGPCSRQRIAGRRESGRPLLGGERGKVGDAQARFVARRRDGHHPGAAIQSFRHIGRSVANLDHGLGRADANSVSTRHMR